MYSFFLFIAASQWFLLMASALHVQCHTGAKNPAPARYYTFSHIYVWFSREQLCCDSINVNVKRLTVILSSSGMDIKDCPTARDNILPNLSDRTNNI